MSPRRSARQADDAGNRLQPVRPQWPPAARSADRARASAWGCRSSGNYWRGTARASTGPASTSAAASVFPSSPGCSCRANDISRHRYQSPAGIIKRVLPALRYLSPVRGPAQRPCGARVPPVQELHLGGGFPSAPARRRHRDGVIAAADRPASWQVPCSPAGRSGGGAGLGRGGSSLSTRLSHAR